MTSQTLPASKPRFCSQCGTQFLPDALFCHNCGSPVMGVAYTSASGPAISPMLKWGLPAAAILALVVLTFVRRDSRPPQDSALPQTTLLSSADAGGSGAPPDISSMTPEERASRLFNRVMRLWSENKNDSAAFFAPMAMQSLEAITPLTLHSHYDMGLVALASGDAARAAAESDKILKESPTHLLGLALAARVADAQKDVAGAKSARQKLLAAEASERAKALPEYADHATDLQAAMELARKR